MIPARWAVLFVCSVWAGAQNALAGGGTFITLPALLFAGLDARAANITSTVAMFPGQIVTGWYGRSLVGSAAGLSFRSIVVISLLGGAVGALLLLATPTSFFEAVLPYLVAFSTCVFAWGSFGRRPDATVRLGTAATGTVQFAISVYGGYFGGGIGFLMLAALALAGVAVHRASALKNVLAGMMNASAVAIFLASPDIAWTEAAVVCAGALVGGRIGTLALRRLPSWAIQILVVCIGAALTMALFLRR